jgi:glycosyltransferase involved in cell wall biosynthesis
VRVVLVSHSAQPGGSNQTVLSLLRHRPPDAECECVFLEDGPVLGAVEALGVPAGLLDTGRAREVWRGPGAVRALQRLVERHRAEIVFAHVSKAHLYASLAARRAGVPYLWWQHESASQKPLMQALSARLPARVVVCSSHWTAARQGHPRGARVQVIHPGPELDPPPPAHAHTASAGGTAVIGVVGRLQRWKRVELAVEAMRHVHRTEPAAILRIIGGTTPGIDEGYGEELRARAEQAGITGAVEFRGHVTDVRAELAEVDVLLHTARCEPFGLVMVEAMAQHVPVVAVSEGGPLEILRDGVDGLLAPDEPEALASRVLELISDPRRRTRMGSQGSERARELFSAQQMAEQTWTLVRSLRP